MTDKTPEEKASELAASVSASKTENKANPIRAQQLAVLAASVVIGGGFLAYINWPTSQDSSLKTSESTSFVRHEGDAFGNMNKPVPPKAIDPNPEYLKTIADLKAQIEELRNRKPETVRDDAEIQKLNDQLGELQKLMERAQADYQRSMQAKDIENQRLQAQLDAMRIANGQPSENEDAKRLAAEALWERRVKSPLNPLGTSGGGDDGAKAGSPDTELDMRRMSQNELFARYATKQAPMERAQIVANPSNTVLQGTVIQASLETAINTDLPGMIRAVVSEDVHSLDGSRILIPRGAKVLGKYSDNVTLGQKRVMVIWDRLLLPDNQTVTINSYGADAIGQAGMKGKVDTHFFERFGSATLISVIGIAPAVATASLSSRNNNSNSNNSNGYNDATNLANAISQNMQSSLGGVVGEYLNRPPTIGVKQGANITIFVDRDLEIF